MIKLNHKKPFFQFFPILFLKNDTEKVLMIGLGHINISFVSEVEKLKEGSNSKLADGDKEFVFIWYKKTQIGTNIHYTEPFRTKIKAANREDAVEGLKNLALKRVTLCIHDESDFSNLEYSKMRVGFNNLNQQMKRMTKDFDNNFK